ncbi:hypothetical protein BTUL_0060g00490 [Botrytis tulipae]|uniref:Uncharacterized protein n=1 Tax=Botrytis tulipae TaxID=87230 RepID=A0A4Z1EXT6_9HELO|nr:hypothetical protein BTUL_0060g00490 [Botrytis tulipae]
MGWMGGVVRCGVPSVPYIFCRVPFIGRKKKVNLVGGMGGELMENLKELTYQPPASSQTFDIYEV